MHVLAYYLFTSIEDPRLEVARHQEFLMNQEIRCRIYISEEGINGQMSASPEGSKAYQEWLQSDPRFASLVFKVHTHHEHAFPRKVVKYRKQLVAIDVPVDMKEVGEHLSPRRWSEMLEEQDEDTVVLDVRNDYEWAIGHFEGAEKPPLGTFREFPQYAKELKKKRDPKKTRVMMCCTGGIRCEIYSALLKQEGFEEVYQLDGGIINYGLQEGQGHWRGKLFVFDDRLAVAIDGTSNEVISSCQSCDTPSDLYYNCANMDCNALFLSCKACADKRRGCCCVACEGAERVRLYRPEERPKPFKRMSIVS
jgi:UPF0176 protein